MDVSILKKTANINRSNLSTTKKNQRKIEMEVMIETAGLDQIYFSPFLFLLFLYLLLGIFRERKRQRKQNSITSLLTFYCTFSLFFLLKNCIFAPWFLQNVKIVPAFLDWTHQCFYFERKKRTKTQRQKKEINLEMSSIDV